MSITNKLWENNLDIALLSLKTKFVQGLKTGNLPILLLKIQNRNQFENKGETL